jgi:hypothetical protein
MWFCALGKEVVELDSLKRVDKWFNITKTRRVKRKNKKRFQSFFVAKQGLDFGLWEIDSYLLICFYVRILTIILASVNHISLNFIG